MARLVALAKQSWDEALTLGEAHGYRNAQATVIAPTGTIGLVMDCDTTGIEPDFALVKFKKLAGGGLLQDHQPVGSRGARDAGLLVLPESRRSSPTRSVTARWVRAPGINHTALIGHGFGPAEIEKVETALPSAFDIRFVFNQWTLGEDFCTRTLGIPAEKLQRPDLRHAPSPGASRRPRSTRPTTMSAGP